MSAADCPGCGLPVATPADAGSWTPDGTVCWRGGRCEVSAVTGTRTIALSASTVAALALYGAVPTAAEVRAALTRALRRHALTDLAAQRVADRW